MGEAKLDFGGWRGRPPLELNEIEAGHALCRSLHYRSFHFL